MKEMGFKLLKLGVLVILLFLPFLLGNQYYVHVVVKMAIWCIAVLGLGILVGFTGQISVAHSTFLGIGAYSSALLSLKLGLPFWACLILAGLISAMVGVLLRSWSAIRNSPEATVRRGRDSRRPCHS